MDVKQAIFEIITNNSDVSALISDRLYPQRFPKEPTFPLAIFVSIPSDEIIVHGFGASNLKNYRFQFETFASTNNEATQITKAIKKSFGNGVFELDEISIHGFFPISSDSWDFVTAESINLYRVFFDARILFKET